MLKLDIVFFSTSLAIFMNNQDPQVPRKTKRNGVKNLKRAQATPEFHLSGNYISNYKQHSEQVDQPMYLFPFS